jgi:LmbE family N-acetylglucosaminyl deacetylase
MRALALAVLATSALLAGASDPALPPLAIDRGAAGVWQTIAKLQTTASLLYTTAHPDDEQGGLLAYVSRGLGARTELLTLNRGEGGDNAIGPELFDALGLIRTDELARAGQFYGLDVQYFTQAADYGFSKRLDEAFTEWDHEALLRDMVRIIRRSRPLVVISRWQGNERDGHGQHQASGALTPEAVSAAADASRFPELAREGLRPWRVRKLYRGGVREDEAWSLRVDTGAYDPVFGATYQNLARIGLSFQRSQNGGQFVPGVGPAPLYYARMDATSGREAGPFAGLDTSIAGMCALIGVQPAPEVAEALHAVAREAASARDAFTWSDPSRAVPALARGLSATRRAKATARNEELAFLLDVKERQFQVALASSLALTLTATAEPAGTKEPDGPAAQFASPATLDAVTPGTTIGVRLSLVSPTAHSVRVVGGGVAAPGVRNAYPLTALNATITSEAPLVARLTLPISADAPVTRPYFARAGLAETRYTVVDSVDVTQPFAPPAFSAHVEYEVDGVRASIDAPVLRREANLPYGYDLRELEVLPPVSLALTPGVLVVPADHHAHDVTVGAQLVSHVAGELSGALRLELPAGWSAPSGAHFTIVRSGIPVTQQLRVSIPPDASGVSQLRAAAQVNGRDYRSSYQALRHRDLPIRYFVRDATALVSVVDVTVPHGVRVGYVMGIGDQIPAALEQLGVPVTLLDSAALASADLSQFTTIMTGTRAYAVRDDLRAHNARLLDWVRGGGNMVVLYNTPEFVPSAFAPYPAELPADAEEVSEQGAAVEILEPSHPFLTTPNRIVSGDFDGWIEQRGSKFFASWDPHYVALVSSHDRDQPPQRGGWVTATFGKGRWTYMAYALHRQVPFGVAGAYRILANLIAP